MKLIAIGDIHGRNCWKDIIKENEDYDICVFVGDYFDSRDGIDYPTQIQNFKDILQFKKDNFEKVILLFGNHDYHYLSSTEEHYSGHNHIFQLEINEVLSEAINKDLVQMAYFKKGFLFTHAGVSKTWCKKVFRESDLHPQEITDQLNDTLKYHPNIFKFNGQDNFGNDITQSPIWIRPESLIRDALDYCTHVVGHTMQPKMSIGSQIILIDTLDRSKEYLVMNFESENSMNVSFGPKTLKI